MWCQQWCVDSEGSPELWELGGWIREYPLSSSSKFKGTILKFRAEGQCHLVCFQTLGAVS